VINVKAPSGSRLEVTNQYIARVENDIRQVMAPTTWE
jgi:hydrophobic/amphiphilic exporter-1 (mainly G- bacteria), HAE1 family